MQRIQEAVQLNDLETITMTELRGRPGEVMRMVELGRTFIITKGGKPLGVLSRIPGEQLGLEAASDGTFSYVK
jgi:antitoxin (DNA-binding transcriptional repressor) of toxin-antitoxin stability system